MKKYEDFVNEAQQYSEIIKRYEQNGEIFTDPNFLPTAKIIESDIDFNEEKCVWLRIDQFYTTPLFKKEAIKEEAIQLGELDNSYFYASLIRIAKQPELVELLFDTRTRSITQDQPVEFIDNINIKCGAAIVYFYVLGKRTPILIDTLIPFNRNTQTPLFIHPTDTNYSAWFCLIEKAYAKLYGSYSAIIHGKLSHVMYQLFNYYPVYKSIENILQKRYYKLSQEKNKNGKILSDNEFLFSLLMKYQYNNAVIAADIPLNQIGDEVTEEDIINKGLLISKTYLILKVRKEEGKNFICLKSPINKYVWNGDYSSRSTLWTNELKRKLGFHRNNGTFWMKDTDFFHYFASLDIAEPVIPEDHNKFFTTIIKPSENDGFDIDSPLIHLENRQTFVFKPKNVIDESNKDTEKTAGDMKVHITVEKRTPVSDTDIDSQIQLLVVFAKENKIEFNQLIRYNRQTVETRNNFFKFTVHINEKQPFVVIVHRSDKMDIAEDVLVKFCCKNDFDIFDFDFPDKPFEENEKVGVFFCNKSQRYENIAKKICMKKIDGKEIQTFEQSDVDHSFYNNLTLVPSNETLSGFFEYELSDGQDEDDEEPQLQDDDELLQQLEKEGELDLEEQQLQDDELLQQLEEEQKQNGKNQSQEEQQKNREEEEQQQLESPELLQEEEEQLQSLEEDQKQNDEDQRQTEENQLQNQEEQQQQEDQMQNQEEEQQQEDQIQNQEEEQQQEDQMQNHEEEQQQEDQMQNHEEDQQQEQQQKNQEDDQQKQEGSEQEQHLEQEQELSHVSCEYAKDGIIERDIKPNETTANQDNILSLIEQEMMSFSQFSSCINPHQLDINEFKNLLEKIKQISNDSSLDIEEKIQPFFATVRSLVISCMTQIVTQQLEHLEEFTTMNSNGSINDQPINSQKSVIDSKFDEFIQKLHDELNIDQNDACFDALLQSVAQLKTKNEELHKRFKELDQAIQKQSQSEEDNRKPIVAVGKSAVQNINENENSNSNKNENSADNSMPEQSIEPENGDETLHENNEQKSGDKKWQKEEEEKQINNNNNNEKQFDEENKEPENLIQQQQHDTENHQTIEGKENEESSQVSQSVQSRDLKINEEEEKEESKFDKQQQNQIKEDEIATKNDQNSLTLSSENSNKSLNTVNKDSEYKQASTAENDQQIKPDQTQPIESNDEKEESLFHPNSIDCKNETQSKPEQANKEQTSNPEKQEEAHLNQEDKVTDKIESSSNIQTNPKENSEAKFNSDESKPNSESSNIKENSPRVINQKQSINSSTDDRIQSNKNQINHENKDKAGIINDDEIIRFDICIKPNRHTKDNKESIDSNQNTNLSPEVDDDQIDLRPVIFSSSKSKEKRSCSQVSQDDEEANSIFNTDTSGKDSIQQEKACARSPKSSLFLSVIETSDGLKIQRPNQTPSDQQNEPIVTQQKAADKNSELKSISDKNDSNTEDNKDSPVFRKVTPSDSPNRPFSLSKEARENQQQNQNKNKSPQSMKQNQIRNKSIQSPKQQKSAKNPSQGQNSNSPIRQSDSKQEKMISSSSDKIKAQKQQQNQKSIESSDSYSKSKQKVTKEEANSTQTSGKSKDIDKKARPTKTVKRTPQEKSKQKERDQIKKDNLIDQDKKSEFNQSQKQKTKLRSKSKQSDKESSQYLQKNSPSKSRLQASQKVTSISSDNGHSRQLKSISSSNNYHNNQSSSSASLLKKKQTSAKARVSSSSSNHDDHYQFNSKPKYSVRNNDSDTNHHRKAEKKRPSNANPYYYNDEYDNNKFVGQRKYRKVTNEFDVDDSSIDDVVRYEPKSTKYKSRNRGYSMRPSHYKFGSDLDFISPNNSSDDGFDKLVYENQYFNFKIGESRSRYEYTMPVMRKTQTKNQRPRQSTYMKILRLHDTELNCSYLPARIKNY